MSASAPATCRTVAPLRHAGRSQLVMCWQRRGARFDHSRDGTGPCGARLNWAHTALPYRDQPSLVASARGSGEWFQGQPLLTQPDERSARDARPRSPIRLRPCSGPQASTDTRYRFARERPLLRGGRTGAVSATLPRAFATSSSQATPAKPIATAPTVVVPTA